VFVFGGCCVPHEMFVWLGMFCSAFTATLCGSSFEFAVGPGHFKVYDQDKKFQFFLYSENCDQLMQFSEYAGRALQSRLGGWEDVFS